MTRRNRVVLSYCAMHFWRPIQSTITIYSSINTTSTSACITTTTKSVMQLYLYLSSRSLAIYTGYLSILVYSRQFYVNNGESKDAPTWLVCRTFRVCSRAERTIFTSVSTASPHHHYYYSLQLLLILIPPSILFH